MILHISIPSIKLEIFWQGRNSASIHFAMKKLQRNQRADLYVFYNGNGMQIFGVIEVKNYTQKSFFI